MTRRRFIIGALTALALMALLVSRMVREPLLAPSSFSRAVYDRHHTLLRLTLSPSQTYRVFTPLEDISPQLINATLEYEDRHFYRHPGFNPVALIKAFTHTYVNQEGRRGGSTITMQLARMKWGEESRSITGKVVQLAHALQLEWLYSKHDILEAYLNLAPYGGNIEGVGAASLTYFHKPPGSLALPEAMALAVMPQSPARRTPVEGVEPDALRSARLKLAAMRLASHPGTTPQSLALDSPLTMFTVKQLPFRAPHAVNRALAAAGAAQAIELTIDSALQTQLERLVRLYVERRATAGIDNAAVMLVDVETSEVLAQVGSADFFDPGIEGQVDGTSASRSPGSALKPMVYARALDEGLIHPKTLLKDVPMRFGSYNPENFDTQFMGPMSASDALVRSRNVPAVDLDVRLKRGLYEVLQDVEVKGLREKKIYGAGIVLGAVEVTMHELLSLYVALGRGGVWSPLKEVTGSVPAVSRRLVSAEAAQLTLEMLTSDEQSLDAWATPRDAVKVAWKTGTSHAYRDAWTVGLAGRYAIAVWAGQFNGASNPSYVGRSAAAPLFFDVVGALREQINAPEGHRSISRVELAEAEVCSVSGKRPGPNCPHVTHTKVIPGVSPIDTCDVHRVVHLDVRSGLRRCEASAGVTRDQVFEFWRSDIAHLFARAGFARRAVPAFAEGEAHCAADEPMVTEHSHEPRILSPQSTVTYQLRRHSSTQSHVPLIAHTDGAAHALTWFAGTEMIGTVSPGQSLEWSAPSGKYDLRAVDDHGNTSQVTVTLSWAE